MKQKQDDLTEISRRVKERRAELETVVPPAAAVSAEDERLPSKFIDACLRADETGLGWMFDALKRDSLLHDYAANRWLFWAGHHFELDRTQRALAAVDDLVDRLAEEVDRVSAKITWHLKKKEAETVAALEAKRKLIVLRIKRLWSVRGRQNCLISARTGRGNSLGISGDELDQRPWLLPCKNGVVDLRSGELRPGRPGDRLLKASPISWPGLEAEAPLYAAWLSEIFEGNDELVGFVQRVFGSALIGLPYEHAFFVLWGQGRNGKGTLVELLHYILGPLACPVPSEMLLDQGRARSSAGPSPDIMMLQGIRLAIASETDDGRKFSPSRVKWLSGGDTLVGRHPHAVYPVKFTPSHSLVLLTNHRPVAPPDDYAFWERLYLIPFRLSFVSHEPVAENERRAKKGLIDALKKEAPAILAWLVRGCLEYQRVGLGPPRAVIEATADYRRLNDDLGEFLDQFCSLDERHMEQSSALFDKFDSWYRANRSSKGTSQAKFGKLMGRRFERKKTSGITHYLGLKLRDEELANPGE